MAQRAPTTSTTFCKHDITIIFVILKSGTAYTRDRERERQRERERERDRERETERERGGGGERTLFFRCIKYFCLLLFEMG